MIEWQERNQEALEPELIEQFQLSSISANLLAARHINTAEKLDFWLNSTEADLADPKLMHDLVKAVERINQAIDHGEKITVYGDYDADGITATTIMVETLSILGADVHYFIPDRFKDGYGPKLEIYKQIVANGTKLIITVDNGVTGIEEVKYANQHGVDTIITDHHKIQDTVPPSYALVHSNYPGQKYPFDDYCGAGVAYTICRELMQDPMTELLDLVMIGTIGDMVKVSGEGHIIIKQGLKVLNKTQRPGLLALIKNAGLNMGQINETDIGFSIAPRLNAVGRLANAKLAVELLLAEDEETAKEVANEVEQLNDKRKVLTEKVYQNCCQQIKSQNWYSQNTLVIYNPEFHEGVLGLVANKIASEFHKPTIILTKNATGIIKGSGRSVPGFNLFNALIALKGELLTKFGGHDFACGLSLEEDKIVPLRQAFEASFTNPKTAIIKKYDLELPFNQLDLNILSEIELVGPFGTDNEQPIFKITSPQIKSCFFMGKEKNHINLSIEKSNKKLEVVGFNKKFLTKALLPYVSELFIQLQENCYRKQKKLQGIIEGIVFAAPKLAIVEPVIDLRQEKHVMGFADRYLLFDDKNRSLAATAFNLDPQKIISINDYEGENEVAVLLDAPHSQKDFDAALTASYKQLYLRFILDCLPVRKIPTKTSFEMVLKYVYLHPGLAIEDYRQVAPFIGLDFQSILFILRVFSELNFVELVSGKLFGTKNPAKKSLTASKYLVATQSQISFVQQLRQMPSSKLLMYVKRQLKQH